jgi:hypothetical protein
MDTMKNIIKWFVRENTFLTRGVYMDFGWGNGYVCIPPNHPLHGVDYSNFPDLECNGGLTFSEHASKLTNWKELPKDCKDCWIVGFDTAHSWDRLSAWPKESVEFHTKKLAEQIEGLNIEALDIPTE